MSRRSLISAKMPDDLHAAVKGKMESTKLTQSQAVIEALRLWCGLPASDRDDRLALIESRLSALEQRFTPVDGVDRPKPPKTVVPVPAESTGSTVVDADGLQWLTTSQAFAVATTRGCDRGFDAFRSWSKRNPAECESMYRLRHIAHGTKSNTAASFEDVSRQ